MKDVFTILVTAFASQVWVLAHSSCWKRTCSLEPLLSMCLVWHQDYSFPTHVMEHPETEQLSSWRSHNYNPLYLNGHVLGWGCVAQSSTWVPFPVPQVNQLSFKISAYNLQGVLFFKTYICFTCGHWESLSVRQRAGHLLPFDHAYWFQGMNSKCQPWHQVSVFMSVHWFYSLLSFIFALSFFFSGRVSLGSLS